MSRYIVSRFRVQARDVRDWRSEMSDAVGDVLRRWEMSDAVGRRVTPFGDVLRRSEIVLIPTLRALWHIRPARAITRRWRQGVHFVRKPYQFGFSVLYSIYSYMHKRTLAQKMNIPSRP